MSEIFLLAVSIGLSGAMLQSAPPGEKPIAFSGAYSLATDGAGAVWAFATDCRLYRLRAGRAEGPIAKNDWAYSRLAWDGKSLLLLVSSDRVFRLGKDATGRDAFLPACTLKTAPGGRLGNRGIACPSTNASFAKLGAFFWNDDARRQIVVCAADGAYVRDFAPYPTMDRPGPIEAMGFMPETGDLVVTTGYPDCRAYRFTADGKRHDTSGWPAFRGDGVLQPANGRLWHLRGTDACALERVYNTSALQTVDLAPDTAHRGYAVGADGWEYHASYQALRARKLGTPTFHRIGGLGGRPSAMAADARSVYLYGGSLRRIWLDEPADGSYAGDDGLRQTFSYSEGIVGLAPFDGELFAAAPKSGLVFCSERYRGVPTSGSKWRKVKTGVAGGCLAVAADELSREIHFSMGGDLYRGAVVPTDGKDANKWAPANVARVADVSGVGRLVRAPGSPYVAYATTNGTVGVFAARTGKVGWTKPVRDVRGIAAVAANPDGGGTPSLPANPDGDGTPSLPANPDGDGTPSLPGYVVVSCADGVLLLDVRDGAECARYGEPGMEFGAVAATAPWIVVEERKGNRLLRLKVIESLQSQVLSRLMTPVSRPNPNPPLKR